MMCEIDFDISKNKYILIYLKVCKLRDLGTQGPFGLDCDEFDYE